jgi:hypothetical protein
VLAVTNGVGWSPRSREAPAVVDPVSEESSFDDRFDAVFEQGLFGGSALMQRMAELTVATTGAPDQAPIDGASDTTQTGGLDLRLRHVTN